MPPTGYPLHANCAIVCLHTQHGTFKRVTFALHMCDMILEERISDRKYV